jgi:hypothetical protein
MVNKKYRMRQLQFTSCWRIVRQSDKNKNL